MIDFLRVQYAIGNVSSEELQGLISNGTITDDEMLYIIDRRESEGDTYDR